MRFPVSRRALLLVGASGASLSLLSGCGVRLDTPPDVPTLDETNQLRNRVARILAATTAGDDDPETAGEDLQKLRDAIGPVWSPPTEIATESPPAEEPRTYIAASEAVSTAVFTAVPTLGSGLIPVLVDVATGLALTAGAEHAEIIRSADALIQDSRRSGRDDVSGEPESATASGSSDAGSPRAEDSTAVSMWNAILDQARAASYGYERLAVNFDAKSRERSRAVARLESLGLLAGEMLENLGEKNADPGAPAWTLNPSPTDPEAAKELAGSLEDNLAAALLPWLHSDPRAAVRLWESARTRTVFASPQVLRYSYSGGSGEAEARK
ncbi:MULTISPECIES: hypothetical protein [Brevibacterium]|uniref:DUF4439 domain-containing protein n=1 Tax=Brevibacterium antiquum CNRZ 918 TaxID=1255637 RepID=A0A2H1JEZ2_9MICO|nr:MULTISPECIES: hypothetical protein [Brevibacterium]SMX85951.1 hypothetical protein BANT918_01579 [Brevibacterium antiquum CNRZ 918]HCG55186.1 hypothetical protein [Brevibacterium sp.]